MSKYDGVLNRLIYMLADNDKFYSAEEKIKICNVVKEAIAKAKKYDNDFADEFAKKEMEIGRLAGKIYDLERENKVLKDGIKAIKSAMVFKENEHIGFYNALWFYGDEDYNKIKDIVEVVENENN